jgi:predicted metal-binding membrane protein
MILFVAGYVAIWMAAGALLLSLMFAVRLVADGSSLAAAIIAAIAVVWQCSPVKQRCLNRGHAHPELAATGSAADVAVLRFGLTHGVWCVGSCWALMLMPLLFSGAHLLAMAAVSLWLVAERIESPLPLCWRLRVPHKAVRLAVARASMMLQRGLHVSRPAPGFHA